MSQSKIIAITLVTLLSVLRIQAQSTTPTSCQAVTGMSNLNATQLTGLWYEEIRAPAKNVSCVEINVSLVNNQTLGIKAIYSASKSGLLMDKLNKATVNISEVNANTGFNVSYSNTKAVNTTYKILSTDYNTNVVLCGYTNLTDPTTSFGIILTRKQIVNSTWLMQVKNNASESLSIFSDSSYANITQSAKCYTSSAGTSVPALVTLFAAFYTLLKFFY